MSPDPRVSLLVIKLFISTPRPERVSRSRLLSQLDDGLRPSRRLILVSAPPGLGKTTLLGQQATGTTHDLRYTGDYGTTGA